MIAETIAAVAKAEGFSLETSAAELVTLLAEGSFRDALSILQKVLAMSKDKKVDIAEVEEVTGAPKGELVRTLLSGIAARDAERALTAIRAAEQENIDARLLTKLLIHRLRAVLVARFAPEPLPSFSRELSEADTELVATLAKDANVTSDTLRSILEAHERMAYAAVPYLPLEMAVADICAPASR